MPPFTYEETNNLLQTQSIFIDLINHLINYAGFLDETLRNLYYECLKIVFCRNEFNIYYMGFGENQNQEKNMRSKKFQRKIEVFLITYEL